jgi:hypothetical protein
MKNLLKYGFIAFVICLSSCTEGGKTTIKNRDDFNILIFEDCEYIYNIYSGYKSLTHKGNCNNPIHNCR